MLEFYKGFKRGSELKIGEPYLMPLEAAIKAGLPADKPEAGAYAAGYSAGLRTHWPLGPFVDSKRRLVETQKPKWKVS